MRFECYGASRPKAGRAFNEDAFLIDHGHIPFAALCDGAGNAEQAAKRVLTQFQKLFKETSLAKILIDATWCKWIKLLDSLLLGGAQSTFLAATVVGNQVVGAYAGDSWAYFINDGTCTILTGKGSTPRLGSGKAVSTPFRINLKQRNVMLLMSDGAWTPLNPYLIQKAAARVVMEHFPDLPQVILDAAERTGRLDDMTAIALRITQNPLSQ